MKQLKTSTFFLMLFILLNACKKTTTEDSGTEQGTGTFTLAGQTYKGSCNAIPAIGGCSGKVDITITQGSTALCNAYAVPSSGSASLIGQNFNCNSYLICNVTLPNPPGYTTVSGTVTRTGTNSFSFTGTVKNNNTSVQSSISGSGTWK
jgi:hypothetical protein